MAESNYGNIYTINIGQETINNIFYKKVLFTSGNLQLVVMSIKPGEDVPFEIHENNDQFIRIEKGKGSLLTGINKEYKSELSDGVCAIIPANTWHQIINTSDATDLKLYTIYAPPHYPKGTIEKYKPKCEGNQPILTPKSNFTGGTLGSQVYPAGVTNNYNTKKDTWAKFSAYKKRNFLF